MELSTDMGSSSWGDQVVDEVLPVRTLVPVGAPVTQRDLELLETSRDGLNMLFKQASVGAPAPSSFAPGILKRDPNNPWVSEAGKKRLHVEMTKGDTVSVQSPGVTASTSSSSGSAPGPTASISTPALPLESGGAALPPSASPSQDDGRVIVRGKRKEGGGSGSGSGGGGAPTNPPLPPPTSFSSLRREGVSFASTLIGGAGASTAAAAAASTVSTEGSSSSALEGKQKKTRMEGSESGGGSSATFSSSSASSGFGVAATAASSSSSAPPFQWGPLPVIPPALSAALTAAAAAAGASVGVNAPPSALAPIDSATALVGLAWSLGGVSSGGGSGGVSVGGGAASVSSSGGAAGSGGGGGGEGEEGEEADKSTKQEAEPLTEAKIAARRKQIDLGKSTPEYNNYVTAVPKHMRSQDKNLHPRTPNPERECSKRKFTGMVLKWRTALHAWDEPAGGAGVAQAPPSQQQ